MVYYIFIALLLCIILTCQPVLAVDFVGEVAEEAVEEVAEQVVEESVETAIEEWEGETQDDWNTSSSAADDHLFDERVTVEGVSEEVFEDVALDVSEDNIFFADAAEDSQFSDSIVGAEIVDQGSCGENATSFVESNPILVIVDIKSEDKIPS